MVCQSVHAMQRGLVPAGAPGARNTRDTRNVRDTRDSQDTQDSRDVRTMVYRVLEDCASHGLQPAPQLAQEAVRLLRVDPEQGRDPDQLLAACVHFLLDKRAPGLAATRMRIAFRRKYRTPGETAAEQARVVESRLVPLLADIMHESDRDSPDLSKLVPPRGSLRAPRRGSPKDRLYGSVVAAAVLRSGLGSPADPAVITEANEAMQSVYPERELQHLLRLPAPARRAQLLEVCRITAGVRIFNWDCRKAGHGLIDLPGLVQEAAAVSKSVLQASVRAVESRLWPATAALEVVYQLQLQVQGYAGPQLQQADLDLLKESVIYYRQQQVLLRRLLEDVEQAEVEAQRLISILRAALAEVHAVVQAKTAVPSNQVYPQFVSLACTWEALEAQAVVVSKASNLHRRLESYSQGVKTTEEAMVARILNGRAAPTDAERVSAAPPTSTRRYSEQELAASRRRLARDLERGDVAAELEGFCPWFLAVSGGGLVPGCPALGLCEVGGREARRPPQVYALSSLEAAQLFAAEPDRWIQEAMNAVRRRPAMVGLLGLVDSLLPDMGTRPAGGPVRAAAPAPVLLTANAGVQTEARCFPPPPPPLRLSVLPGGDCLGRSRATASQTDTSMYRRPCQVQTFPLRDAAVQCPRSVACSAGESAVRRAPQRVPGIEPATLKGFPGSSEEPGGPGGDDNLPSSSPLAHLSPSRGKSYIQNIFSWSVSDEHGDDHGDGTRDTNGERGADQADDDLIPATSFLELSSARASPATPSDSSL